MRMTIRQEQLLKELDCWYAMLLEATGDDDDLRVFGLCYMWRHLFCEGDYCFLLFPDRARNAQPRENPEAPPAYWWPTYGSDPWAPRIAFIKKMIRSIEKEYNR